MDLLKTTPKTHLVQSLEEIQEVNEMFEVVSIIESYIRYINSSMAVPNDMLKGGSGNYLTVFPDKPTMIKIDVTK